MSLGDQKLHPKSRLPPLRVRLDGDGADGLSFPEVILRSERGELLPESFEHRGASFSVQKGESSLRAAATRCKREERLCIPLVTEPFHPHLPRHKTRLTENP
ncbi:MAG TPA: hypothetical protein VKR27_06560, partial [Acidimicrobiales bacterium]|nr:hypothetical protein [Acidimicrobiales bacterium]